MQLWTMTSSWARPAANTAAQAEADGWDGLGITDSQNRSGDAWVAMTLAAGATTTLALGTAVTNPITRHPAVTAAAAQSLANVAGPRITVGIGRGDSSLAHLGKAPAKVGVLEGYTSALRTYLRGGEVAFDDLGFTEAGLADVSTLGLADTVSSSRLTWRQDDDPLVTVEVAASGPKVIAAAARSADRIIFALGADPERLRWGMDTARQARAEAGLDPDGIEFAAYLNVVTHPDVEVARMLAAGAMGGIARFSSMHGTATSAPSSAGDRQVFEAVHRAYDMHHHGRPGGGQAKALTPEFMDRFGILGRPDHVVARLHELIDIGLTKAIVIGPTTGSEATEAQIASRLMVAEVLPALRRSSP